ncbi:hypothetical protein PO909_024735 [Leuciscus waleckii]
MDPSTGNWDFYWYKDTLNPETEKTETNSYSLKNDSVSDGGQYWCRAGRGKPVYYTQYSDALWVNVTGLNNKRSDFCLQNPQFSSGCFSVPASDSRAALQMLQSESLNEDQSQYTVTEEETST